MSRQIVAIAILISFLYLAHCMPLEDTDDLQTVEETLEKRDRPRRIQKYSYRHGYLFGKRSDVNSRTLFQQEVKEAIQQEVKAAIQRDPILANYIARFGSDMQDENLAALALI